MEIPTTKLLEANFREIEFRMLLHMLCANSNAQNGYKCDSSKITGRTPHPPEIQWF